MSSNKEYVHSKPQAQRQKKLPFGFETTHYVELINRKLSRIRKPLVRGYLDFKHFDSSETPLHPKPLAYSASTVVSLPDSAMNHLLVSEIDCYISDSSLLEENIQKQDPVLESHCAGPNFEGRNSNSFIYAYNIVESDLSLIHSGSKILSSFENEITRHNSEECILQNPKNSDFSSSDKNHETRITVGAMVWLPWEDSGDIFAVMRFA